MIVVPHHHHSGSSASRMEISTISSFDWCTHFLIRSWKSRESGMWRPWYAYTRRWRRKFTLTLLPHSGTMIGIELRYAVSHKRRMRLYRSQFGELRFIEMYWIQLWRVLGTVRTSWVWPSYSVRFLISCPDQCGVANLAFTTQPFFILRSIFCVNNRFYCRLNTKQTREVTASFVFLLNLYKLKL